jgi:hypothetical protein
VQACVRVSHHCATVRTGTWLFLREGVAAKLAEAEEQARADAEIAANSSSSTPPPPTFPRMYP